MHVPCIANWQKVREEHRSPRSCINPQPLVWKAAVGFEMWVPEEVCSQFS